MSASQILFYIIAAFILGTGILSVTTGKIFRSAIWLLASLVGIAALFFWMEMEFIAAVQIVVYVGGIVVLIIFSIFLTQQSGKEMSKPSPGRRAAAVIAVLSGVALVSMLIYKTSFHAAGKDFEWSMKMIGSQMLNANNEGYALPFEVISILLLAAMIGCIVIAMRTKPLSNQVLQTSNVTGNSSD